MGSKHLNEIRFPPYGVMFYPDGVMIDTGIGCNYKCAYCTLAPSDNGVNLFQWSSEEVVSYITSSSRFVSGLGGAVVTVGHMLSDPFDEKLRYYSFDLLRAFSSMRNPVRVATKTLIDDDLAESIAANRCECAPFLVHISISTITYAKKIEPNAAAPIQRMAGIKALRQHNLQSCLYIKPVLPKVTIRDLPKWIALVDELMPDYVVVGTYYRRVDNQSLREKPGQKYGDYVAVMDKESLEDCFRMHQVLSKYHPRVYINGICTIINATGVTPYVYPNKLGNHLCVRCGFCRCD